MSDDIKKIITIALDIISDNAERRRFLRTLETSEILDANDFELVREIEKTKSMLGADEEKE